MPRKGRVTRLPRVLSAEVFLDMLRTLGGEPQPGGKHQSWRFATPNGVRSIPISNYPEYPIDYYRKVLVHELGLTNRHILALLNGDQVQIPRSASARPPLSS
jgi:hypothetical protein